MTNKLIDINGAIKTDRYVCHYTYENGQSIVVILTANQLKIDVEMSAE